MCTSEFADVDLGMKFFSRSIKIISYSYENIVKFIYSEKVTNFCEIFALLLTGTTLDKSKVKISQNLVAFSKYMNFNYCISVNSFPGNYSFLKV